MFRLRFTSGIAVSTFLAVACQNKASEGSARAEIHNPNRLVDAPEALKRAVVLVFSDYVPGKSTFCSGTLISATRVLTAKHCVDGADQVSARWKIGFDADMTSPTTPLARPKRIRLHTLTDLATIDFEGSIGTKLPATLAPIGSSYPANTPVAVGGYGKAAKGGSAGRYMRWGIMVLSEFTGQESYPDGENYSSNLRISRPPGGSVLCGGDSGGGTYVQHKGKWVLLGVNSGSEGAGERCDSRALNSYVIDVRGHKSFIFGTD
jgi:hypothetical protein